MSKTEDLDEFERSAEDSRAIEKFNERELRLWALCEALPLNPKEYGRLHDVCYSLLQRYTMAKYQEGSDYTRSRELLTLLAKQADELLAGLRELRTDFRVELLYARRDATGVIDREHRMLPHDLEVELHDFSLSARFLADLTPAKSVGTPGTMLLRAALKAVVEPVEYFLNQDVRYSRWKKGDDSPHFLGVAGEFLRDFWLTFEPQMTERQLANAMRNLRERSKKKPAKSKSNRK